MANAFRAGEAACGRCTYFDDQAVQATNANVGGQAGLCRYNPPVSQPSSDAHGLWPVVAGSDWCGHFEPGIGATAGTSAQTGMRPS